MDADRAKKSQLVAALAECSFIKAAALVDAQGDIRRKEGDAKSFRDSESDDETQETTEADGEPENVFLLAVGSDYLIVVFEQETEYDDVKAKVDALTSSLDLAV